MKSIRHPLESKGRPDPAIRRVARRAASIVAALLAFVWAGCDRPFVEISTPEIEILEPDPNRIVTDARVEFAVRASSFRPIDRVVLAGEPMDFNASTRVWSMSVDVAPGLSELVITAYDTQGVAGTDTAVVVYIPFTFSLSPASLPFGRGNHAAILMTNGDILVTGGSFTPGGEGTDEALIFTPGTLSFDVLPNPMTKPRVGHTMVNTPDGRVLIVGGGSRGLIRDVLTLVVEPEIFDPVTGEFNTVPVRGDPILRAEHTMSARNTNSGFYIDLFGGIGDVRAGSSQELGIRPDIRTFLFHNDTLIARSPDVGGYLSEPISGHTQASLSSRSDLEADRYLIHGTWFGTEFFESTSFTVDFADSLGLLPVETGVTLSPRTHHASAALAPGLVATFGGIQGESGPVVGSIEIFADRSDRFLTLPIQARPLFRYQHTATKLADNRILLAGGFDTNGNSLSLVEYFVFSAQ
ncbi:MAG: hypothetical protein HKN37_12995 [Rhodothermales bacterium]|nr:hypothetical protein [Rhodothermales bacterium]